MLLDVDEVLGVEGAGIRQPSVAVQYVLIKAAWMCYLICSQLLCC